MTETTPDIRDSDTPCTICGEPMSQEMADQGYHRHPHCMTDPWAGDQIRVGRVGKVLLIELPGSTAIRIDPSTRTIAVDGISGEGTKSGPSFPEWFIADLRYGTYGDFHRLRPAEDCFDPTGCAASGQHNALYPHVHETVEEVGDCQECINRAADLRFLADA